MNLSLTIRQLSLFLVGISVLLWVGIVSPLFTPGYLVSFDHPLHQGLLQCAKQSTMWSLPSLWCDHLMAGVAPFQVYPAPFYMLVIFLAKVFTLQTAYKVGIALVWLLIPTAAWLALSLAGWHLAGSIAFALLLLHPSNVVALVTDGSFFNQMAGTAFLILSVVCLESFLKNSTPARFSLLCLVTATSLLFHPSTFLFIAFPALLVCFHHRQALAGIKWFLIAYPLIVFLLSAWWTVPFILNYFDGFYLMFNGGIGVIEYLKPLPTLMHPLLIGLGLIGSTYILYMNTHPLRLIPIIAIGILGIMTVESNLSTVSTLRAMQAYRLVYLLKVLLVASAAIMFEAILKERYVFNNLNFFRAHPKIIKNIFTTAIAAVIFYMVIVSIVSSNNRMSEVLVIDNLPILISQEASKIPHMQGRLVLEDTVGQSTSPFANRSSLWGFGPLLFKSPVLAPWISYPQLPYGETFAGRLFGFPVFSTSRNDIQIMLEMLNIEYLLASSEDYRAAFNFLEPHGNIFGMLLLRNNATPLGWFKALPGQIIDEEYQSDRAKSIVVADRPTQVVFKVRYWPNWKAWMDGHETTIIKGEGDLMRVNVPKGRHHVRFEYGMILRDYLGWVLTFLGIALVLSSLLKPLFIKGKF